MGFNELFEFSQMRFIMLVDKVGMHTQCKMQNGVVMTGMD